MLFFTTVQVGKGAVCQDRAFWGSGVGRRVGMGERKPFGFLEFCMSVCVAVSGCGWVNVGCGCDSGIEEI